MRLLQAQCHILQDSLTQLQVTSVPAPSISSMPHTMAKEETMRGTDTRLYNCRSRFLATDTHSSSGRAPSPMLTLPCSV